MDFILTNWWLILIGIAALVVLGFVIYKLFKTPLKENLAKVKEWLIYAVACAEKELGSGTGQIKLRAVYDQFLIRFPFLVAAIPFEMFSKLVDEALDKFNEILTKSQETKAYVENNKESN